MDRHVLTRIVLEFEDGSTRSLEGLPISDDRSGVLFWNDFSVQEILVPFYRQHPELNVPPERVLELWSQPGQDGKLPGFLMKPLCSVIHPDELP